jgi:hypothetical protein
VNSARTLERTDLRRPTPVLEAASAEAHGFTPWTLIRASARSIAVALASCFLVLLTIELAFFRSGFFVSHVTVSNPQSPAAKLALAARQPDARVLYVGDSTVMTSVLPAVVSSACACGPGFNSGFSAATPWLTDAMTRRLLGLTHPRAVVISASPWMVDGNARFDDSDLARQLMPTADLERLGARLDLGQRIDAGFGGLWSAYGQRQLLTEWVGSLAPGQRYDEALLGYWVAAGSIDSHARLIATADRLFEDVGSASSSAPGALVIGSLIDDLRARGIAVVFLVPPLHPTAYEEAAPYLERAEVAIQELASQHGVPIVDCRSSVTPADFRDVTHLQKAGAEKHSACVGEHLRALVPN